MADKKISALTTATTPLTGTEVLPIVQSGTTVKVANNDLRPKQIQSNATSGILQVTGPATAATRVMTTPDADFTAARTDAGQTFTGNQTFAEGDVVVTRSSGNAALGLLTTSGSGKQYYLISDIEGKFIVYDAATGARFNIDASGNALVTTGNLVIGTSSKGITTGSSIPLGIGVNNGVNAVTVGTSNEVMVGSATSLSTTVPLQVTNSAANQTAWFENTAGTDPNGLFVKWPNAAPNDTNHTFLLCLDSSGAKFALSANGSCYNSTGTYNAFSDEKLKENIVDASPKLDKLTQVKIRNFNLKGDSLKQIGVIAQELEQVFPNLVEEVQDKDENGELLETTTKAVKYSVFVPILIKAIQEQQEVIKSLESRIVALETK